jgi:hypothetical protein
MRQMISGLVAAVAVLAASAVPAMACGFQGCSPCGQAYVSPCAQPQVYQPQVYVAPEPVYSGCNTCAGGWAHERLPDPVQQYYYVNQGPTYTGPGNWAPRPTYQEGGVSDWHGYRHHPHYYGYHGGYRPHAHGYHYGYAPHRSYYGPRMSYAPHHYGYREHVLRRYY